MQLRILARGAVLDCPWCNRCSSSFPANCTDSATLALAIIIIVVGYQLGRQLDENIQPLRPSMGLSLVFLWFLKGAWFRVDTNKRVDRFTADYIHGGYQYCPLQSVFCWLSDARAACQLCAGYLFYTLKSLTAANRYFLFLAQVMLPLFLPPQFTRLDRVLRAIAGLIYLMQHTWRRTCAAVCKPYRGQTEAGSALGLSTPLVLVHCSAASAAGGHPSTCR